jgi:His-Xaa-Ser system protein HxsD
MSETTMFDESWVALEFDEELYSRDAIHGAAYVFIDRCYLHLERAGDKRLRVRLKAKKGSLADTQAYVGDFGNEALGQAWRRHIAGDNRATIESITARGLAGAAGPPGLDDLLAMDIGAETAFEDPLGIAMSWEEKYTKKKGDKAAKEEAAGTPAAAPSTAPGEAPITASAEPSAAVSPAPAAASASAPVVTSAEGEEKAG